MSKERKVIGMGKSLKEIRERVAEVRRIGGADSWPFDALCEALEDLIEFTECGGDYRPPRPPHGQDPSEGYLEDGRGGFVREAPAPGFMQPSGRRIGGA